MALDQALQEEVDGQQIPDGDGKRERSTIKFPYGDLTDAVYVAKGVHAVGGTSCEWEQLAAHLKLAADGGGFRGKMLTAKIFGVVEYSQRKVTLTALGSRICDPKQEKAAKAEAFLAVPLYKAVYDKFKGNTLPPPTALAAEMGGMGVSEKQTDKARQYFQRSAEQAGFFWSGQDRLVMPPLGNGQSAPSIDEHETPGETKKRDQHHGSGGGGGRHPLIEGLIRELPEPKTPWPIEARKNWLQLASSLFNVIYESSDDTRGSLKIEIQKDSAK